MSTELHERLLKIGYKKLKSSKYNEAIKCFYRVIKARSTGENRIKAFIGLGDALKYIYELELAEKMYQKASQLARTHELLGLLSEIEDKIINIYVIKKDREIKPVQIEFFMRSIMKLLSKFGKTDWF